MFTITAVLLLGLGIGATTAVFSLFDTVLLKPLPYQAPDRIVIQWNLPPANLNLTGYVPWGPMQLHAMEKETKTFRYLGSFEPDTFNLTGTGDPIMLEGMRVSFGFFPSLGVTPDLGCFFLPRTRTNPHEV